MTLIVSSPNTGRPEKGRRTKNKKQRLLNNDEDVEKEDIRMKLIESSTSTERPGNRKQKTRRSSVY